MDIIKQAQESQKKIVKESVGIKNDSKSSNGEEKERINWTKVLMKYITDSGQLFVDQFKTPSFLSSERPFLASKLDSNDTRRYLAHKYWKEWEDSIGKEIINTTITTLEARAVYTNDVRHVYNRVARLDDTIFFDIADNKHVIEINSEGWGVKTNSSVLFKRYSHQQKQVLPEKGGHLTDFLKYTNIKNELHNLLVLTYLPVCLIPDIPRALIAVSGDQGSGKTFLLRLIRSLVDPSAVPIMAPPDSVRDLVQFASHHYVNYLDNLSRIQDWLSDGLCRLVTGDGFSKRQLYTDDEDILYSYRRVAGICGINQVATRADLLDRCIIVPLERITDKKRQEEREIIRQFNQEKPKLFGALLDAVSACLRIAPSLELDKRPRMADYFRYACAVSEYLGYGQKKLKAAFDLNVKQQNHEAIEASAVAQTVIEFLTRTNTTNWESSSSELYQNLLDVAEDMKLKSSFPRSANWLWRRIVEVRPNLMAYGIVAEKREAAEGTVIKLKRNNGNSGSNGNNNPNSLEDEQIDLLEVFKPENLNKKVA